MMRFPLKKNSAKKFAQKNSSDVFCPTICNNLLKFNERKNHRNRRIACIFSILVILIVFTAFSCQSASVFADNSTNSKDIEQALDDQVVKDLGNIDLTELDEIVVELADSQSQDLFEDFSFKSLVNKVIGGDLIADFGGVWGLIKTGFLSGMRSAIVPLLSVVVIALLYSIYCNLLSHKLNDSVGGVIRLICLASISIVVLALSTRIIASSKSCISSLQRQMNIVFPILLSLMVAVGGTASVKAYSPTTLFMSNIISNLFSTILFSVFSLVLIITIANNFLNRRNLSGLEGFLKSFFKWGLGTVLAVFIAVLSIQGATAGVSDGINIKATKYALKNYVPYLGGYISDGFELVKASGIILKNSIGYVALFLLLTTVIASIIKIVVFSLALKLCGALVEPLGESKLPKFLEGVGNCFKMLSAIVIAVALMYFLVLMFIVSSLNVL